MTFNLSSRDAKSARAGRITRRSTLAFVFAIATASTLGACASGHSHRGGGGEGRMIVHLTNDLAPPSDVSVYAVAPDGVRHALGDVPPNDHRVLRIPSDISPGTRYHLIADRGLGRPEVSQPITATSEDMIIDWDLQTNSMWFPDASQ
jgi:hypothetical protein